MVHEIFVALSANKKDIPHPKDWKLQEKEFLNSMGFKSLGELHKGMKFCIASQDGAMIHFASMYNDKRTKKISGFSPEKAVGVPENETPKKIFEALIQAFENCE